MPGLLSHRINEAGPAPKDARVSATAGLWAFGTDKSQQTPPTVSSQSMRPSIKFTTIAAVSSAQELSADWLASIRSQRHQHWEAILVEYEQGAGRVLRWSSANPRGLTKEIKLPSSKYDALNLGLSMATGDVISFLPCDCTYADDRVFERVAQCMEDAEVDWVCADIESQAPNGRTMIKSPAAIHGDSLISNGIRLLPNEDCLFVRQDWWRFFGGFETSYRRSAGLARTLDLVCQPGIQMKYINEVLVKSKPAVPRARSMAISRMIEELRIYSSRGMLLTYLSRQYLKRGIGREKLGRRPDLVEPVPRG